MLKKLKLDLFLILITILVISIYAAGITIPETAELTFFVLLMLVTGIPHGATDHVIHQHVNNLPVLNRKELLVFVARYLGIIAVYGLVWFFFPVFSLVVFLILSCYHFGQSQLYFVSISEKNPVKSLLYLSWGTTILGAILVFNYAQSLEILRTLIPDEVLPGRSLTTQLVYGAGMLTLLLLAFFTLSKKINTLRFGIEMISMGTLLVLSYFAPLLIAFAVYFALWHSLKTMQTELETVESASFKVFYKRALPFSVLSFFGIGILLAVSIGLESVVSPYLVFFIAVSTLTLPHMVYRGFLYAHVSEGKTYA